MPSITPSLPEIAAAVAKLRPDVLVLDGEVAVFDENLSLVSISSVIPTLCPAPPMFIALDMLQVGRRGGLVALGTALAETPHVRT